MWLDKAMIEAPYLRDPYMERALLEYQLNNWQQVEYYCLKALEINSHQKNYINEVFSWDNSVYDLLSLSYYYQNNKKQALKYIKLALEMAPNDKRLLRNLELINEMKESANK